MLGYGSKAKNIECRKQVKKLIDEGQAHKSLALEIGDVRRVARDAGDPRRYNQALLQASRYAKTLTLNMGADKNTLRFRMFPLAR